MRCSRRRIRSPAAGRFGASSCLLCLTDIPQGSGLPSSLFGVIAEIDIWRVATLMIKRYGGQALLRRERMWFAQNSLLEGARFEPSVPP